MPERVLARPHRSGAESPILAGGSCESASATRWPRN
jgi:hypothetical protein